MQYEFLHQAWQRQQPHLHTHLTGVSHFPQVVRNQEIARDLATDEAAEEEHDEVGGVRRHQNRHGAAGELETAGPKRAQEAEVCFELFKVGSFLCEMVKGTGGVREVRKIWG